MCQMKLAIPPATLAAAALAAHRTTSATGCHIFLHVGRKRSCLSAGDGRCFLRVALPAGDAQLALELDAQMAWSYYGRWRRLRTPTACTITPDAIYVDTMRVNACAAQGSAPGDALWEGLRHSGYKPITWILDARALARMQRALLLCAMRRVPPLVQAEGFLVQGHYAYVVRNPYVPSAAALIWDRTITPEERRLVLPEHVRRGAS